MGFRERKQRALKKLAEARAANTDYAKLADLIHRDVAKATKGDGEGDTWCLTYAILGCAYLNYTTGLTHTVVGGKLMIPTKRQGVAFEHFWVGRRNPHGSSYTVLDFATRHNPAFVRRGIPDIRPDEFEEEKIAVPYYIGSSDGAENGGLWSYHVEFEPSSFAVEKYLAEKKFWEPWLKSLRVVGVRK